MQPLAPKAPDSSGPIKTAPLPAGAAQKAAGAISPAPSLTASRVAVPMSPAPGRPSSPPPAAPRSTFAPGAPAAPTKAAPPPSAGSASPFAKNVISERVAEKVAQFAAAGPEYAAIAKLSREIIEQIAWEVVPELAETIIRSELDRLTQAQKK
jgi:hypothetical protein